ncbi:MAG TPA: non-homologous end-joining DNA ligase [Paracoccaceae bacterium]|nr:non-homologous end-joining DNA ligase [Paracoccaceae bacterium]
MARRKGADGPVVAGVRISSPDREMFPGAGVTKLDVARYYAGTGPRMLGTAARRPFSLVRCPDDIGSQCFFQKHANRGWPEALREVQVEETNGAVQPYLYATSPAGLVAAAQMGTIEFHLWGAHVDRLERPDRFVIDLDPDEGLDFATTRAAAVHVRDLLRGLGLDSAPLLTGGKGIHLTMPLRRTIEWDRLKAFARAFAYALAETWPDRYVAKASKAERKGRIFVDWMRNERGATAIAPWSVRARNGATIATPVSWDELDEIGAGDAFSIRTIAARLERPCPGSDLAPQSISGKTMKALEKGLD